MYIDPQATPDELYAAMNARQLRVLELNSEANKLISEIRQLDVAVCLKTGGHEFRPDGVHPHSGQNRMRCRKCDTIEYQ